MYLIIGGNGYLGNYIIQSILALTNDDIVSTARNISNVANTSRIKWIKCDITDDNEFDNVIDFIKNINNIKVIFLAAYHHPDKVAENPQFAWNINVTTLSKCINKLFFVDKLFYASTDSVYGNSINNHHFKEDDVLNPVNIYGKNKCAAEAIIKYYGFNVVRYPFLIAHSLVKNKLHFYDKIVNDLKSQKEIEMFADSFRSSLNFKTAADLLIKLCELNTEIPHIVNISGDSDLSKYDIGLMIADKLGADKSLVKPITMNKKNNIFISERASSTLMDNSLIKNILNIDKIDFII